MDRPPSPDDLPSRLGRAMLLGAWVVGLLVVAFLFDGYLERDHNPNPAPQAQIGPDGAAQVVLQRNRSGHYVADGFIDGHPVVFLLDTGATHVALPLSLARRLGLALRSGGVGRTANGDVPIWVTRLEEVSLGGLTAKGVAASVLPGMEGDEVLLGMSFLKRFEWVQRGNTMTLRVQPH